MISLAEVQEHLREPHKYGGYLMALCEFHDDHSPSMRVSLKGYFCLSCQAHGSLEYLYEKISGRIVTREKYHNGNYGLWRRWSEKFGSIPEISKIAHLSLMGSPAHIQYLNSRKLTEKEITYGNIGMLDSYYTFPIKDEFGKIQGMIVRATPSTTTKTNRYSVSYQCPIKLYIPSWRNVMREEELYVCYGTVDVWTLHMAGYAGITGISGQELNAVNLDRFRKPIYIIPDRGEERKTLELQANLGWRGLPLFLDYPEGCKDLNDVHKNYGIERVKELISLKKEKYLYE